MQLAAPSIWRPQSLLEWFTEGKAQRDPTSGKIKRNSTSGKAVRNSATNSKCCCAGGLPCFYCSGVTPRTWTLVASSVSLCACANVLGGGGVSGGWISVTGDVNGTFTLTQNFSAAGLPAVGNCGWGAFTSATTAEYSDATCTTKTLDDTSPWWLVYMLDATHIQISCNVAGLITNEIFLAVISGNCLGTYTGVSNLYSGCGVSDKGSGGSVTITANP